MSDPAGSNGSIQFNSNGTFGGAVNVYSDGTSLLFTDGAGNTGTIQIYDNGDPSKTFRVFTTDASPDVYPTEISIRPGSTNSNVVSGATVYVIGGYNLNETGVGGQLQLSGGWAGTNQEWTPASIGLGGGANIAAVGGSVGVSIGVGQDPNGNLLGVVEITGDTNILGILFPQGKLRLFTPDGTTSDGNPGDVVTVSANGLPTWMSPIVPTQYQYVDANTAANSATNNIVIFGEKNILDMANISPIANITLSMAGDAMGVFNDAVDGSVVGFSIIGEVLGLNLVGYETGGVAGFVQNQVCSNTSFRFTYVANNDLWYPI